MKYLKTFQELNEGKGRYTIKGNQSHAGDVNLPQFWTTSKDYMKVDNKDLKTGHDPKEMIMPVGNDYVYLTDPDDHIDQKEIDKMVEPHTKKSNDFGFDPSKK